MPNYDFKCGECLHCQVTNIPYNDRDDNIKCQKCQNTTSTRYYGHMPGIRTEKLSASFVDGQKRPGIEKLKRLDKLRRAELDAKDEGNENDFAEIRKATIGVTEKD